MPIFCSYEITCQFTQLQTLFIQQILIQFLTKLQKNLIQLRVCQKRDFWYFTSGIFYNKIFLKEFCGFLNISGLNKRLYSFESLLVFQWKLNSRHQVISIISCVRCLVKSIIVLHHCLLNLIILGCEICSYDFDEVCMLLYIMLH